MQQPHNSVAQVYQRQGRRQEGLEGYGSVGLHTASMIVAGKERVFKCQSKKTPPFRRGHKDRQFGDCPLHFGGLYIYA